MRRHHIYLTLCVICISTGLFAQNWVSMMRDPNANVHDVQTAFYQWYDQHKNDNTGNAILRNGKGEAAEEGTELFKRWEYYMVPRTFPSGNRPNMAAIANEYHNYLSSLQNNNSSERTTGSSNWVYVGNTSVPTGSSAGNGDGRINRVHFYPGNTNTIYATAPGGGLWKYTNGGSSWSTNTDHLEETGTSDIAINPLNPSIMYLAMGDNDGSISGNTQSTVGVLRSTDGGTTWNTTGLAYTIQSTGPSDGSVNQVSINPQDTGFLYAGTSSGLYYSKNDGTNWTRAISDDIRDIEFEPSHNFTVYASSMTGKFYRSIDSGKTFTQISTGLPSSGAGRMAIGVTAADSNMVYILAADASSNALYGVYRSTDRGQTFATQALLSSGAPNILGWSPTGSDNTGQGEYDLVIAVSPTHSDSIYVGGPYLWTSSDGGVSWSYSNSFSNNVHVDIHSITFYPGSSRSFLLSCDGGVYKTTNRGNSWTDISNNLEIAEEYSIGASADNPNLWISGWQDNNVDISGTPWTSVYGGDGMTCFIDYTSDNNMFCESEYGSLAVSNDGGNSWSPSTNGITEQGSWNTPWLQDPQQPNVLYAGFQNVWVSSDQGNSWTQLSTWGTYYINAIAIAPANDNYIYASQSFSIYATTNSGASWTNVTHNLPVGLVSISNIAVDQFNPQHVWVTFSGWNAFDKVYESTNGGSTWTNISTGLPNLPVNCIISQPGSGGIYVGTDIGVYYRDNTTGGWIQFSTNLPNVEVFDLALYKDNTLIAATFGRGTWQTSTYATVNTSANNMAFTNSIKVYPNPTNGSVHIAFDGMAGEYNVNITNILGQTVFTNTIQNTGHYDDNVNLSNYGKGVYVVSINGMQSSVEKKVVVY